MSKKRVSKKNKSSWRKHVNINDVEDFLEDQRSYERSEKHEFAIDRGSSNDASILSKLTKKEKSRRLLANPRCFQILKPHTQVPDPIVKRNRVRTKEERKNLLIKLKEADRKAKGILKAKEKDSIKGKELYERKKLCRLKEGEILEDLWEIKDGIPQLNNWIKEEAKVHNLRQTGTYLKKVIPSVQKKPSVLPTVEPPHPGMSYNPSFEDHQRLLKDVADKEHELIKKDKHLNRVTRTILRKVDEGKQHKVWLKEMSQGLPIQSADSKEENIDEGDVTDTDYKSINPPVKNKKKTLKQRRKQREHLLRENLKKISKIEKKKVSDLHKLKHLTKYADLEKEKIKLNMIKRKNIAKIKRTQPKRLAAKKFEEKGLDFNMPQEVSGNLRCLKKESSLLIDRFKSMQKRSIIPPSSIVRTKKGKTKRFVKPGHKDDWKVTVAGFNSTILKKTSK